MLNEVVFWTLTAVWIIALAWFVASLAATMYQIRGHAS